MFANYLKTAVRNLVRRKLFSFINLTGLALGIAFMLLIGSFIYFEISYNHSFENIDSIYRLVDLDEQNYRIDFRVRDAIIEKIPGVKDAGLLYKRNVEVNHNNEVFEFKDLLYVDESFFKIFNTRFINSNATVALAAMEGIVLTESTANRLFGTTNPIGQKMVIDHEFEMVVTGVVEDMPANSSFKAQLFVSAENTRQKRLPLSRSCQEFDGVDDSQCKYPMNIFIQLEPQADPDIIAEKIPLLFNPDDYRFPDKVQLIPFRDNYFNNQYPDFYLAHGNITQVRSLALIGLIILILAVINYTNLTTAAYKNRLTEIGMKKCLGAQRRDLSIQFLIESMTFTFFSAALGVLIAQLFLPYFNQYIGKELNIEILTNHQFGLLFLLFIFLLSLLTGFLPALLLSRISPLVLFRFKATGNNPGNSYRGILSIFQFSVAIILICFLLIISSQVEYAKHRNPGFKTEQLLYLNVHYKMRDKLPELKSKLRQYNGLKSLTVTNGVPGIINIQLDDYNAIIIDSTSLKTFGFELVKGRNLTPGDLNKSCLINTTALANFANNNFQGQKINDSEIVGVVSDFIYAPIYQKIEPLVLYYSDWGGMNLTMRIAGPIDDAISYIHKSWMEICPDFPFNLNFYDESFAAMYRQDENLAQLIKIFTVLALAISCLGIFGLAVFQSGQRVKEIGVRKVLGARVTEIITMLTANIIKWVLLANIFAWPVAYIVANKWLENYAYRIELNWWLFILAGFIVLVIALTTVSLQAVKAAMANPVDSLRYE